MSRSFVGISSLTLVVHSLIAGELFAQPATKQKDRQFEVALPSDEFGIAISTPLPLLYLELEVVRADLKFSKEQSDRINTLLSPWDDSFKGRFGVWTDLAALRENLGAGVHAEVNRILTGDQHKRLNQIIWRHREKEYGMPVVINALVNELKLSDEQRERFDRLRFKRAEIVLEQVTADERLTAIRREIHQANSEFAEKFQQLLTPVQQTKWMDLLGEPFAADIKLKPPRLISLGFHKGVYLERLFQTYSFEADFLANESVQKELKMEDDQVRKVKEFWVEWTQRVDGEIKDRMKNKVTYRDAALSAIYLQNEYVADNLRLLLKQNQWPRFRSIMIQHRISISGPASAYGYPGVAELVGIKDDDLESIRKRSKPYNAASKKDLEIMSNLIGKPFTGEVKFDSREVIVSSAKTVANPEAAKDARIVDHGSKMIADYMIGKSGQMRLSETQISRLKEIAEEAPKIREILHKELSNLPPPSVHGARILPEARAVEQYKSATLERCLDVLDDKQRSLFGNQIRAANKSYQ